MQLPVKPATSAPKPFLASQATSFPSLASQRKRSPPPARRPSVISASADGDKMTKVLFVCLGNICRSPSAEAVFRAVVQRRGVADAFTIDSCGTGGGSRDWYSSGGFSYHEGDPADSRMTRVARERGVHLTSISRPLRPSDLLEFDVVLGMDATNIRAIKTAAEHWRGGGNDSSVVPEDYQTKLGLMTDYLTTAKFKGKFNEVPDPYYGGQKGFELVLDLLEDACEGLLDSLQEKKRQHSAGSV